MVSRDIRNEYTKTRTKYVDRDSFNQETTRGWEMVHFTSQHHPGPTQINKQVRHWKLYRWGAW